MPIRLLLAGLLLSVVAPFVARGQDAKEAAKFPEFADVRKAVSEHLAETKGYKSGDILSTSNVEPVFAVIEKLGWKVADEKEFVKATLPDNDYLVRQLRTKEGRKFQRNVGNIPLAYDRFDRIRNMPRGSYRVRELIEGPDGFKMIEYMTTTKGGRNLGRYLDNAENGKDFNQPTGRIYTEANLLARLQLSYDAELEPRNGGDAKVAK